MKSYDPPLDAAQMLNIGWQIADIACHFKATNEQVIAAICEYIREQREESRRLRRQASLRKKRVK